MKSWRQNLWPLVFCCWFRTCWSVWSSCINFLSVKQAKDSGIETTFRFVESLFNTWVLDWNNWSEGNWFHIPVWKQVGNSFIPPYQLTPPFHSLPRPHQIRQTMQTGCDCSLLTLQRPWAQGDCFLTGNSEEWGVYTSLQMAPGLRVTVAAHHSSCDSLRN